MTSTKNCLELTKQLKSRLDDAEAVVVGAGAGLSAAAGLTYTGARFRQYFADFEAQYGFHDMYTGGFYPYQTSEEYWAYWSRYIDCNRYVPGATQVYQAPLKVLRDRDYFVLTTNVDHQFQLAGVDKARLFYTQGDYGLFQCSVPCHDRTYGNERAVRRMCREQRNMRIPSSLVPRCPACGAPMSMNLRADGAFVEDAGWHAAYRRYTDFIRRHADARILFLELGVGGNTPGIIKYPFWEMTVRFPGAFYVCVNLEAAACPAGLEKRSLCISADLAWVIAELL